MKRGRGPRPNPPPLGVDREATQRDYGDTFPFTQLAGSGAVAEPFVLFVWVRGQTFRRPP